MVEVTPIKVPDVTAPAPVVPAIMVTVLRNRT